MYFVFQTYSIYSLLQCARRPDVPKGNIYLSMKEFVVLHYSRIFALLLVNMLTSHSSVCAKDFTLRYRKPNLYFPLTFL